MSNYRIGVIGSGVIGLSTALHLADQYRNADLCILTDKELEETTSYGPGGLYRPSLTVVNETTRRWCRDSYDHYVDVCKSSDGPAAGVQLIPGYCLNDTLPWLKKQEQDFGDIVANFKWLDESDLELFNVRFKHGFIYTATTAQSHYYVPWLAQKARQAGCKFETRHLNNFDEISDRFDMLINCTGLGARQLVPDESVIPIRGVTVNVSAPWAKHFLVCDDAMSFVIPGIDSVFLGTLRQENNWSLEIDPNEKQKILDRCCQIMPSLKQATFKKTWTGLRPYRPTPRLEVDKSQKVPIIHNYGHGGNGITLSWGCAMHVERLVREELRMRAKL